MPYFTLGIDPATGDAMFDALLNLKARIPLDELEAVYGSLGLDRYTRIGARWTL
jgi:hypothetical protein